MKKQKKILIVGAGITGCTLAALLEQKGIVPTIVDRARKGDKNGYGITIMPTGMQVLETLGIRPAMEKVGGVLEGCELYSEGDHKLNSFGLATEGIQSITLDRGDLLAILRSTLQKTSIRWQTSIRRIMHDTTGAWVTFTDGTRRHFDLVVGADGINSVVRAMIAPDATANNVGAAIWMCKLPANCTITRKKTGRLIWGNYRFMALFPYKDTAAVAFTMPFDPGANPQEVDVTQAFGGMSRFTDKVLRNLKASDMYCGHLRQVELADWYKGQVVLAGDAAHAMVPATGMGASNGIQDASVLAQLITEMPLGQFGALPKTYQRTQKPRVDSKQQQAYVLGRFMLLNRRQAHMRNQFFSLMPPHLLGRAMVRR